ncbi:MAG: hypothetical protein AAGK78_08925 [Planctomycetota bacterium]
MLTTLSLAMTASHLACRPTSVAQPLTDTDPVFVIPAIKQAASESDPQQLSELVALLDNEDAAIRIYAVHALRDRTGEHFGYEPWASEEERAGAVEQWRAHVGDDESQ